MHNGQHTHRLVPIQSVTKAEDALAFLFGIIFNQAQRSEKAWQAPFLLKERVGSLAPNVIASIPANALSDLFSRPPAIHPFAASMADYIRGASELLCSKYNADARLVWAPALPRAELVHRLMEFPGIGSHKARVAVFLLEKVFGVACIEDGSVIDLRLACPSLYFKYEGLTGQVNAPRKMTNWNSGTKGAYRRPERSW